MYCLKQHDTSLERASGALLQHSCALSLRTKVGIKNPSFVGVDLLISDKYLHSARLLLSSIFY